MLKTTIFTFFLLSWAIVLPVAANQEDVDLQSEWHGLHGGAEATFTMVVRDVDEWQGIWTRASKEPPVSFDPEKYLAVGIFLGPRPSDGYSIEIISSHKQDNAHVIEYLEKTPAADKARAENTSTPYVIKLIPRTDLEIEFRALELSEIITALKVEHAKNDAREDEINQLRQQMKSLMEQNQRREQYNKELKATLSGLEEMLELLRERLLYNSQ
jgi:hypothetical protein